MTETSGAHKSLSQSSVETTQSKIWGNNVCHQICHFLTITFIVPSEILTKMSWQVLTVRTASHALSLLALLGLFSLAFALPPGCVKDDAP